MRNHSLRLFSFLLGLTLFGGMSQAHPIVVDGQAADWWAPTPGADNTGELFRNSAGEGEYVWKDQAGDERTNFASPDTLIDLTEVRITADVVNLYILVKVGNLVDTAYGTGFPQFQFALDTAPDSEASWFGSNSYTRVANEAAWEHLLITQLGSGTPGVLIWEKGFSSSSTAGAVAANPLETAVEISVPWTAIGGLPTGPIRFTIASFRSNASDDAWHIDGFSDALDALTNYGTVHTGNHNTWEEVGDTTVNYSFELWFNLTPSFDPASPVLINEVMANPAGSDTDREWIELANRSGTALSLEGYGVGDEEELGAGEGMFRFPTGVSMLPEDLGIVAQKATGFLGDYPGMPILAEWLSSSESMPDMIADGAWATGTITLGNTGDQVILIDSASTVLDVMVYGSQTYQGTTGISSAPEGSSLERILYAMDTNDCSVDFQANDEPSPGLGIGYVQPGGVCDEDIQCNSGICAEGICCQTSCESLCDVCAAGTGACEPRSCDDSDLCTTDSCNPADGQCVNEAVDCDDSNLCTTDSCNPVDGQCLNEAVSCDDSNLCTTDSCNPVDGQCLNEAVSCDDSNLCTTDSCNPVDGQCLNEAVSCDDSNLCTTDSCNPMDGQCVNEAVSCDDSNLCTTDSCNPEDGQCVNEAVDCDDSNLCTTDSCNPADGQCLNEAVDCDDSNLCTTDSCNPADGQCVNEAVDCDDSNLCTTDSCNPADGQCLNEAVDCDDSNLCTTDSCNPVDGQCLNEVVDCDDSNLCTTDSCNPSTGCEFTPKVCASDDNPCTNDACDESTGLCRYTEVICVENDNQCTTASCNPTSGECEDQSVLCDDMDPCTSNTCEPDQGCVYDVVNDWSGCPSESGNNFACLDGVCQEIHHHDRCQDTMGLTLGQESQLSFDGSGLFHAETDCDPLNVTLTRDLFVGLNVQAGSSYALRISPDSGVDVVMVLLTTCDPTTCIQEGTLAQGGTDTWLEHLTALENGTIFARLALSASSTATENLNVRVYVEEETPDIDGDEDGDIDGDEDGDIDGDEDGDIDGDEDGDIDGDEDGDIDGDEDGDIDGDEDGDIDGDEDGDIDGDEDGDVTDDDDDDVTDDDDDVTDDDDDVTDDDDDVTDDDDDVTDDDDDVTDDDDDVTDDDDDDDDNGSGSDGGGCRQQGSSALWLLLLGLPLLRRRGLKLRAN